MSGERRVKYKSEFTSTLHQKGPFDLETISPPDEYN